jgi:hypothetical protein
MRGGPKGGLNHSDVEHPSSGTTVLIGNLNRWLNK